MGGPGDRLGGGGSVVGWAGFPPGMSVVGGRTWHMCTPWGRAPGPPYTSGVPGQGWAVGVRGVLLGTAHTSVSPGFCLGDFLYNFHSNMCLNIDFAILAILKLSPKYGEN